MKRSDALAPLSHDHFEGLHLSRTVQQGLKAGASPEALAAEVCRFWDADLAAHFRQEEHLLLAPLAGVDAAALGHRMVAEHRALRTLVETIGVRRQDADALASFARQLQQHIRFEEREVFPYLERHLAPEALRALGKALQGRPGGSGPPSGPATVAMRTAGTGAAPQGDPTGTPYRSALPPRTGAGAAPALGGRDGP